MFKLSITNNSDSMLWEAENLLLTVCSGTEKLLSLIHRELIILISIEYDKLGEYI